MEDLNAQQIVLLTLLVSFVTSIATGITTVSLLEQAPEPVTQTINRIVEKTVERVVVEEKEGKPPVEKIVETVVVNSEDLTIDAVEKNSSSLVRIYEKAGASKNFVALGVITSETGQVLVDAIKINSNANYEGEFNSGTYNLDVAFREPNQTFAILQVEEGQGTFNSASFANSENLKLAQSVIGLSGQNKNIVTTGIITTLDKVSSGEGENQTEKISLIDTSLDSEKILNGTILINLKGEIVGAKINGDPNRKTAFLPSNQITAFLNSR